MDKCICEIKNNTEELISQGAWVNLYIKQEEGDYYIIGLSDGRAAIRIYYCPICGRSLV